MTHSHRLKIRSIARFFQFDQLGTTYRTEILAGVTTLDLLHKSWNAP